MTKKKEIVDYEFVEIQGNLIKLSRIRHIKTGYNEHRKADQYFIRVYFLKEENDYIEIGFDSLSDMSDKYSLILELLQKEGKKIARI